jgi:hypothetical protein
MAGCTDVFFSLTISTPHFYLSFATQHVELPCCPILAKTLAGGYGHEKVFTLYKRHCNSGRGSWLSIGPLEKLARFPQLMYTRFCDVRACGC